MDQEIGVLNRGKNAITHPVSQIPGYATARFLFATECSDLFVENREIFIPHLYLMLPKEVTRRNFVKMCDADKIRMVGIPCGEGTTTICRFDRIPEHTDRELTAQTDRIAISISRVTVLTRDNEYHRATCTVFGELRPLLACL